MRGSVESVVAHAAYTDAMTCVTPPGNFQRLLVVLPTWVGDAVMATPTLRALRHLYPQAQITGLVKPAVRPVLDGLPFLDRTVTLRPRRQGKADHRRRGLVSLARRLSSRHFDAAVLLPNSFRAALLLRMAGIPKRIGYERDGRGFLLTDRLIPRRAAGGRFVPVPTRDYYLGIARYLGAVDPDPAMTLATRPTDDQAAALLLRQAGLRAEDDARPLVLLNVGANFGEAKLYFPERFAAVADRLITERHCAVAVTGAPKERPILDRVLLAAQHPLLDLPAAGLDLTLLKSIVKRAALMVTNDTGPRHFAAAFNVPVVTIFGPTDPNWTTLDFADERQVRVDVDCSPCQKKRCPLRGSPQELQCMKLIAPEMVFDRAAELLALGRGGQRAAEPAA